MFSVHKTCVENAAFFTVKAIDCQPAHFEIFLIDVSHLFIVIVLSIIYKHEFAKILCKKIAQKNSPFHKTLLISM